VRLPHWNNTSLIKSSFNDLISEVYGYDSQATIDLKLYWPNHLVYETNTKSEQMAVFSEIYYKDGWNAYIDGKLSPYFCSDYVKLAMLGQGSDLLEPFILNTCFRQRA